MISNLDFYGDFNRNRVRNRNMNEVVKTFSCYCHDAKSELPFDLTVGMCQDAKSYLHDKIGPLKSFFVDNYGTTANDGKMISNWLYGSSK